ncbi:DUF1214 domain-containing protein [Rhodococcus sp. NPDC060090]|uniref:DUF1214 domain-containing protein n=1 Tax=Rhodococcus sp. NPDC060090 TaxID=3347056 RepID=UPI00365DEEDD
MFTDTVTAGDQLIGTHQYTVTFAPGELPPVDGFFSMTLYNKHHFYFEYDLGRYSLGTKNPDLVRDDDGSLTFYLGNVRPTSAPHSNWIPAPADDFSI